MKLADLPRKRLLLRPDLSVRRPNRKQLTEWLKHKARAERAILLWKERMNE